ncbi:MAG: transposase [Ignavibacteriales bacterium]|nr:transposase [Ignavibacteriales bacterium]
MKRMTNKPPRWKESFSIYFLTFCTFQHRKILHDDGIPASIIEDLKYYSKIIKELVAYTVMPDHINLLVEIENIKTLSKFLQSFKTHSSKKVQELIGKNNIPFWQRGTLDHCIRESYANIDFENHLKYLFYNSQKHLGISPKDYPFHNFHEIVKRGWLEEDFCEISERTEKAFALYE